MSSQAQPPVPHEVPCSGDILNVTFFDAPTTFVEVPGYQTVWEMPVSRRQAIGVYLWCIDYEGAWLVNYVGKTSARGGFESRLWTELSDWRAGRYCTPVDVAAFARGRRVVVPQYPDFVTEQVAALCPLYRLLLAPLKSDRECIQVESTIVDVLRRTPATYQFLGNADKARKYRSALTPIVRFNNPPAVIGITAPIPQSLIADDGS